MHPAPMGWKLIITEQIMNLIMIGVVLARMYTRGILVRKLGMDDWLCLGAAICAVLLSIDMAIQVVNGIGYHIEVVAQQPERFVTIMKGYFGTLIIYNMALTQTKASIIFQYLRFITHGAHRKYCWAVLGTVVAFGVYTITDSIFMCRPTRFFWDKTVPGGHCVDGQIIWLSNASFDIVTDIFIILLPLPALMKMKIPKKQKLLLLGVFCLGTLVVAISIARLYFIHKVAVSQDVPYDNVDAALWSCVEVQTGVICSALPCLRPLVTKRQDASAYQSEPSAPGGSGVLRRMRRTLESYSVLNPTQNDTVMGNEMTYKKNRDIDLESQTSRTPIKPEITVVKEVEMDSRSLHGNKPSGYDFGFEEKVASPTTPPRAL